MLFGLSFAIVAFVFDQVSKLYIMGLFDAYTRSFSFGKYFNLVEAWNTGVSFSMFDDHGELGKVLLIAFALVVVIFLLHWLKSEQNKIVQASLGLIIGGALGNVWDRICYGAVFDFLDFHYKMLHWPAFNFADTFICVGACLIIISSLLERRKISLKDSVK